MVTTGVNLVFKLYQEAVGDTFQRTLMVKTWPTGEFRHFLKDFGIDLCRYFQSTLLFPTSGVNLVFKLCQEAVGDTFQHTFMVLTQN